MSKRKRRVFSREFKLSAVQRMTAGESAADLSRELGVSAGHLCKWHGHFRRGGAEALRPACRPRKIPGTIELSPEAKATRVQDIATARKRIIELERKRHQCLINQFGSTDRRNLKCRGSEWRKGRTVPEK
jgi:transposase-like protein